MYKQHTAAEYYQYFGLDDAYAVDGVLASGTFSEKLEQPIIEAALAASNLDYEFRPVTASKEYGTGFFANVKELHVGSKVLWYFVAYGGALLSEYLHFGYLFGAQKTVLVGLCGGLKPEANTCEIVIPTAAYADGSSALMYDRTHQELQPSDEQLSEELALKSTAKALIVHRGKTMTCQAMVAETFDDVKQWSSEGYIGVEMEAATVFAVSNHFEKPSAAILSIADNLIHEESNVTQAFQDLGDLKRQVKEAQYQIALETLIA